MHDDPNHRGVGSPPSGLEAGRPDLVAELLHAAGPGPEIPNEGASRIKEAIRPQWLLEVAAHRQAKRRIWFVAGTAAAATITLALLLPRTPPPATAPAGVSFVIAQVRGESELVSPDGSRARITADAVGHTVSVGSRIRTIDGRVALAFGDGASLRIDRQTSARFATATLIGLDRGAVYVDSGESNNERVAISTPLGSAHEVGTQFEVRFADDRLAIRVREGCVAVVTNDDEHEISRGTELQVSSDGAVTTAAVEPFDESWGWVQSIAPAYVIEGRSVASFLSWISRETGLGIRFADPAVERFAKETTLHGTLPGLSPAEALATVLPGSRLTATEDSGVLLIDLTD
jgi:ferric-dicitrate binding protein FerR (iron transport regulator)